MIKKKFPTISIIIPMYNVEKYIGECLDSILAQTFQDFEVIVVDDCSTDKSVKIVENYLPKFNKLGGLNLIYSKEHSGGLSGVPRNTGIRFSRGEYFWFIDSYDVIVENALEELNAFIKNFDVDIVYCVKHYRNFGKISLKDKSGLVTVATDEINNPMFMSDNLQDRMDNFMNK